jgi:hypothetical protein
MSRSMRSSGGLGGDFAAEGLELAEVVTHFVVEVDPGVVVAGSEVAEMGVVVAEQVPGDGQDGSGHRDDGSFLAAPAGDPAVTLAQEGVGAPDRDRGLAQISCQVTVPVPGGAVALLASSGLLDARGELGPRRKVRRGLEAGHVHADLGHDHRCGGGSNPGDLIQAGHRRRERGQLFFGPLPTAAMSALSASTRASIVVSRNLWWSLNRPMNASTSGRSWTASVARHLGQHLGVAVGGAR